MTFFTVVVRGLIRRPVRTGLTLLGISIGIAAVVNYNATTGIIGAALGIITWVGLTTGRYENRTAGDLYRYRCITETDRHMKPSQCFCGKTLPRM